VSAVDSPRPAGPARIGIAVVVREGRCLVGRRAAGTVLAGAAEFPGGKCRPDEPPREAAVRECLEETGLVVAAVRLLEQHVFDYPHGTVDLHFWLCEMDPATVADPAAPFAWIPLADLSRLPFPAANAGVLRTLAAMATGVGEPQ
jgi:mutator protein MutT